MANARQWPKDFVLDAKKRKYAIAGGVDPRQVEEFWEDFHDWAIDQGATSKDWNARFRMRVRKAKGFNQFQGKAIAIKTKPTAPNYLLTTAYYRLSKFGRANMLSYAKENKMTDDDIRSVEGKFEREQRGLDTDQLVGRIGG